MSSRNRVFTIVNVPICAAILLTGAWFAGAGELNPPVGPVLPTHKTLTEVEPRIAVNATNTPGDADSLYKITAPGSYYLTGNITGVASKHGIEIAAGGVTLDLHGFDLVGVPAMGAFDGVSATVPNLTNIAVVNGSLQNWGGDGVDLRTFNALCCRVADVAASGNAGNGIDTGIGSTVSACSAYFNTGNGIETGAGSTVSNCSATANTAVGIRANSGCTVSYCSAFQNTGSGIITSATCTVSNCAAYNNTGTGISAATGSTVTNCSAYQNTINGIFANTGSTVADSTARSNTLDGIQCTSACVIRGNTCSSNGSGAGVGAGIHATSNDNRIEDNNCTGADTGIDVDSVGNFIIRNSCASNVTDWEIAANNVYGPIIDRRAPASAAVSGFTAASSLGSVEPNANFSY